MVLTFVLLAMGIIRVPTALERNVAIAKAAEAREYIMLAIISKLYVEMPSQAELKNI